jgi:hypothetical protein
MNRFRPRIRIPLETWMSVRVYSVCSLWPCNGLIPGPRNPTVYRLDKLLYDYMAQHPDRSAVVFACSDSPKRHARKGLQCVALWS